MTQGTQLILFRDVVKSYGRQRVLEIQDLSLESRTSILLHGRNASGKSTLLKIIGGILQPDSGSIDYHPILKRRRLGFLSQTGGLYLDLSLLENLKLRRHLFRLPENSGYEKWYINELGLRRFLNSPISQLSIGFQRLAAIAATLHCEPHWLLMDEPLSGVDTGARDVLSKHLASLSKQLDLFVVTSPTPFTCFETDREMLIREGSVN